MAELLNYLGVGGFALIFLSVFIEITPIKVNPLQWIGKKINKDTNDKLEKMERKIDDHIVQSYRNNILAFQNECLESKRHTKEQFKLVLKTIDNYEKYIQDNHLKNGEVENAMAYIKNIYQQCLTKKDFVDLKKEEEKNV